MRPASRSPHPWRDRWNEYARGAASPTAMGGVVATGLLLGGAHAVGPDIPPWTILAGVTLGTVMTIAPTASALFLKSENMFLNPQQRLKKLFYGGEIAPHTHTARPQSYRLGTIFPALATLATATLLTAASGTPALANTHEAALPPPSAASAALAR